MKLLKKEANNLIRILWVINLAETPPRGMYCPVRNLPCPIEPTIRPSKPICFIAIPTGEEWKDTNKTVKEVLEEKGVFPYVAVEDITAGRDILCKICERILGSTFGIVELTEKNINVMFEFGLILGRSKPVFILYNKKLAEKISPRIPTDIIALERIEYTHQEELRERFSKGLETYLEKQGVMFEKEARPEASPEEIDVCIRGAKSEIAEVRVEAMRALASINYRRRLADDPRVLEVIKTSLKDKHFEVRRASIEALHYIMEYEEEKEVKDRIAENTIQTLIQIAKEDSDLKCRELAIRSFSAINGRALDTILEIFENSDDETFNRFENVIMSTLRDCSSKGSAIDLTKKLFNLLEKNHSQKMKERVHNALDYVRAGQHKV